MTAPATQPSHRPISPRNAFIDLNAVRAKHGVDAHQVNNWVEEGKFIWVWDVSVPRKNRPGRNHARALRFWAHEIWTTQDVSRLELEAVINRILPVNRPTLRGTEISNLLLVSRPQVIRLRAEIGGRVENHTLRVPRESLAAYLRRHWVGGGALEGGQKA